MGKKEKLITRLKSKPADFTWRELTSLLGQLGFVELQGSGSRVKFSRNSDGILISLHKPHPGNELKAYQVEDVLNKLQEYGDIK